MRCSSHQHTLLRHRLKSLPCVRKRREGNLNCQVCDEISRLLHIKRKTPHLHFNLLRAHLVLTSVRVTRSEDILPLLLGKDAMPNLLFLCSRSDPWGSVRGAIPAHWAMWDVLPSCSFTASSGGCRDELWQVRWSANCHYLWENWKELHKYHGEKTAL